MENKEKEYGFKLLVLILVLIGMSAGEYVWIENNFASFYAVPYLMGFISIVLFFYLTYRN